MCSSIVGLVRKREKGGGEREKERERETCFHFNFFDEFLCPFFVYYPKLMFLA